MFTNVIIICLKDHKKDPQNYRRVSLTSVPEKVMEQIITCNTEDNQGFMPRQQGCPA